MPLADTTNAEGTKDRCFAHPSSSSLSCIVPWKETACALTHVRPHRRMPKAPTLAQLSYVQFVIPHFSSCRLEFQIIIS